MNHANLIICDTESLSNNQTFDSLKLIEQIYFIIVVHYADINRMSILVENSVLQWIEVSLLESHIHDTTKNFEQVFAEVLRNMVCAFQFDVKVAFLLLNLLSDLRWMNHV